MIIDLPHTSTAEIAKQLRLFREERGEVTTGRVLTFLVSADKDEDLLPIMRATTEASREHPARVLVIINNPHNLGTVPEKTDHHSQSQSQQSSPTQHEESTPMSDHSLDARILLGGDAGAAEMIILQLNGVLAQQCSHVITPLLLPDTPIVAWWPTNPPLQLDKDPLGALANRRITDIARATDSSRSELLSTRREHYAPGDTDLSWSRITIWRGLCAAAADHPPFEDFISAEVHGKPHNLSADLAAGWLADRLNVPVTRYACDTLSDQHDGGEKIAGTEEDIFPIYKTVLHRPNGSITLAVEGAHTLAITTENRLTGETVVHNNRVTLSPRTLGDCLTEELRHLDQDDSYSRALHAIEKVNFDF